MFEFFKKGVSERDIPIGAHLVIDKGLYTHHGIFVGDGKVVHYSGKADSLFETGPVEVTSFQNFSQGQTVKILKHPQPKYDAIDIAIRAAIRRGENEYSLFRNNCEHFAEQCVNGKPRSKQIEQLTRRLWSVLGVAGHVVVKYRAR